MHRRKHPSSFQQRIYLLWTPEGSKLFVRGGIPKARYGHVSAISPRGPSRPSPTSLPDPRTVVWLRYPQYVALQSLHLFTAFRIVEAIRTASNVSTYRCCHKTQPTLHLCVLVFSGIQIAVRQSEVQEIERARCAGQQRRNDLLLHANDAEGKAVGSAKM